MSVVRLLLKGLPLIAAGVKAVVSVHQGTATEVNMRRLAPLTWRGVQYTSLLATHAEADVIEVARATGNLPDEYRQTPGAEPLEAILYRCMKRGIEQS